ncbi:hypothetical protein L6R44_10450 [Enterobacter cloacae complex sp. ECC445]|uniref:hypothetical protein n=1 Tax=Enterobacter cloacae complex sp. ECC445 TaxID=2913213 RepID=UPI001F2A5608|nr:hypothetical protein [Enterobacter cloacae complex sp. ECC445]MCG0456525.1 hypothetical protein [Enterobacter cloacae complex sp. ECC445]MCW1829989.1 hypothetical protein [Enterobacter asburiae]
MQKLADKKNEAIGDLFNEVMGRLTEFCENEYRRLAANSISGMGVPINDPIYDDSRPECGNATGNYGFTMGGTLNVD